MTSALSFHTSAYLSQLCAYTSTCTSTPPEPSPIFIPTTYHNHVTTYRPHSVFSSTSGGHEPGSGTVHLSPFRAQHRSLGVLRGSIGTYPLAGVNFTKQTHGQHSWKMGDKGFLSTESIPSFFLPSPISFSTQKVRMRYLCRAYVLRLPFSM